MMALEARARRCLIAGCGDIGSRLGVLLATQGWQSYGLRRKAELIPTPMTALHGDLTDPGSLGGLPEAIDSLVYIAAPRVRTPDTYRATYLDGPKHLLAALGDRIAGLRRVIFVSSTSVYGDCGGHWVDERTPPKPQAFNGEIMLEAEQRFARTGVPLIVARMAGLYGPDRLWLVRRVQEAAATCRHEPPLWTNRIHTEDAARMLAHILATDTPQPLYLGTDNEPATECSVMGWLADQLGLPAPQPVAERLQHESLGNKRLSNQRLRDSGFEFRYPSYREGYAPVIAAIRATC